MRRLSATFSAISRHTVCECGSIGLAAASLHVSQPSATQRLATLERRLASSLRGAVSGAVAAWV
ncbi:LysR family transcriptional regulator [Catellatospora sp. NEAU-YM18]|nr:LysR family transcriptional regulator [Catellatospora tritici]